MSTAKLRLCALQSIDFCEAKLDIKKSSMLVLPFAHSWKPYNLSYAAYSIEDTREAIAGEGLNMSARFLYDNNGSNEVHFLNIKATSRMAPMSDRLEMKILGKHAGDHILGDIPSTKVCFEATGQSAFMGRSSIPLKITQAKFEELGVGVYDIYWDWQYQETTVDSDKNVIPLKNAKWKHFETSMHRIFVTLNKPLSPWTVSPFTTILLGDYTKSPLWAEVLLWSCTWAQGAKSIQEAAEKITIAFNSSDKFKYRSERNYSELKISKRERKLLHLEKHTYVSFEVAKLIERLEGGNGNGKWVNCDDCATVVATFVNLLGGNLQVSRLQGTCVMKYSSEADKLKNRFQVNNIKLIGQPIDADIPKADKFGNRYFNYHTIAWLPAAPTISGSPEIPDVLDEEGNVPQDEVSSTWESSFKNPDNLIFDACLQFVKGDGTLESAAGIRFGKKNDDDYRAKLAAPSREGARKCKPQPRTTRVIRLVYNKYQE